MNTVIKGCLLWKRPWRVLLECSGGHEKPKALHCEEERETGGDGWSRENRERDDVTSAPPPIRGVWAELRLRQKGVFPSLQHPSSLHPADGMNREKETENKACHRTNREETESCTRPLLYL